MGKALCSTPSVVLAALLASSCASASARGKPADVPGLIVPAPPPRVVEPTAEPVAEAVSDATAPTSVSVPPATRTGRAPREIPPKPVASETRPEPKTESKPEPQSDAPPAPVSQLRPSDSGGAAKIARDAIDNARKILSTVDYRPLSRERKKAYDDAKRFADQADVALKQGNVVFAQAVAAKAETLAKELSGR